MGIYLTQWLCGHRHCSIALLWDDAKETQASVEARGEELYASGGLNRWCGICDGALSPETKRTIFSNLSEAQIWTRKIEQENIASRAAIDRLKADHKN